MPVNPYVSEARKAFEAKQKKEAGKILSFFPQTMSVGGCRSRK